MLNAGNHNDAYIYTHLYASLLLNLKEKKNKLTDHVNNKYL